MTTFNDIDPALLHRKPKSNRVLIRVINENGLIIVQQEWQLYVLSQRNADDVLDSPTNLAFQVRRARILEIMQAERYLPHTEHRMFVQLPTGSAIETPDMDSLRNALGEGAEHNHRLVILISPHVLKGTYPLTLFKNLGLLTLLRCPIL